MAANEITDGTTTLSFDKLDGRHVPLAEVVRPLPIRPNVDGRAYRKEGKKAPGYSMTSIKAVATLAAIDTTFDSYRAMVGTHVTVTDSLNNSRTNVLVMDVRQKTGKAIAAGVGFAQANPAGLLICEWTLQATEVPS